MPALNPIQANQSLAGDTSWARDAWLSSQLVPAQRATVPLVSYDVYYVKSTIQVNPPAWPCMGCGADGLLLQTCALPRTRSPGPSHSRCRPALLGGCLNRTPLQTWPQTSNASRPSVTRSTRAPTGSKTLVGTCPNGKPVRTGALTWARRWSTTVCSLKPLSWAGTV